MRAPEPRIEKYHPKCQTMQKIGWRSYWLQAKDPIRCVKAIQKSMRMHKPNLHIGDVAMIFKRG
jgi:hypothetical protein